jgi:hypothetical protein
MGGKLGTIFARAGHEVVFSYARTRKKLEKPPRLRVMPTLCCSPCTGHGSTMW